MKPIQQYIDHTLLKPTTTKQDIKTLCQEAKEHHFFSVCVNSGYVKLAKEELQKSEVKICGVVGFPLGAMSSESKVFEARTALLDGADEIDMVMNIGLLKSQDYDAFAKDIRGVKKIMPNNVLKVILETCYLDDDEVLKASSIAIKCGADFIKTSTGFGTQGATVKNIRLMTCAIHNSNTKLKASGGIRNYKLAKQFIDLGADRLGLSSSVAIINDSTNTSDY
jgi:deoxyribose-phosphate aldolase